MPASASLIWFGGFGMIRRVLPITLAFLAGYFVLCNVFPFAFLVLLFWTAGLFAYLYVLNTVLLYLLAATPALLCIGRKPYGWILAACAAVLVPIVAFVPAIRSERLSVRHAE